MVVVVYSVVWCWPPGHHSPCSVNGKGCSIKGVSVAITLQDIQKVKEQLTFFDVDEAKKASSSKQNISTCTYSVESP